MIYFYETGMAGLYEGRRQGTGHGLAMTVCSVWLVLREQDRAPERMTLTEALHDRIHMGSFVFLYNPLPEDPFIRAAFIRKVLRQTDPMGRGILWMRDPVGVSSSLSVLHISKDGQHVESQFSCPIIDRMTAVVLSSSGIGVEGDEIVFLPPSGTTVKPAYIMPVDMQDKNAVYRAWLSFGEADAGCLKFCRWIRKNIFVKVFNPGFEWCFLQDGNINSRAVSMLPADAEDANDNVDFCFSIYPPGVSSRKVDGLCSDLQVNRDTCFCSFYTTLHGRPLRLAVCSQTEERGCFVFEQTHASQAGESTHRLAPKGDFLIEVPEEGATLLCGLSGLEYFRIQPGAFLRFSPGYPACTDHFPLPAPSPFGAPFDPSADILTDRTTTSWCAVCGNISYITQAEGLELYHPDSRTAYTGLLSHEPWEVTPLRQTPYPLVPYRGVLGCSYPNPFTEELLGEYERTILSAVRRIAVNGNEAFCSPPWRTGNAGTVRVATPGGFLVDANPQKWEKIHLAQNILPGSGQWSTLSFGSPGVKLSQAFSSSNLFLVIINPVELGDFSNKINIQDWNFTFSVGEGCTYGEYRNVMVIKSRKGRLYDPENPEESLFSNPQLWTQAEDFSSPGGDPAQQILLATWLKEYCVDSLNNEDNSYFSNFNRIMQDPDWRGILFLKATLKKENIPAALSCITNGIRDMDELVLHHMGIALSPMELEGDVLLQRGPSSLFGLVHYIHPDYDERERTGVEPGQGEYDFQMLSLKVLFSSSAVQSFESSAQLVINSMFGLRTAQPDSGYNWIFLTGSCQERDGVPVYELRCDADTELLFEGNVLRRAGLRSVEMTSLDSSGSSFMFILCGVMDSLIWKGGKEKLDLFSYGTDEKDMSPARGLVFSNMQIIGKDEKPLYMSMENLRFDLQNSTVRLRSLFPDLRLHLTELMEGSEDPSSLGYLPVLMDGAETSLNGARWVGLCSDIRLGTLGELAGKLSLTSRMLVAWTAGTGESRLYIGLKLPGTGGGSSMLSLQNVLKLSLGQIMLQHDRDAFLLMISNIAIKLFGIKKLPPDGNTMFYLCGPQKGDNSSDLGWFALYNK